MKFSALASLSEGNGVHDDCLTGNEERDHERLADCWIEDLRTRFVSKDARSCHRVKEFDRHSPG